MLKPTTQTPEGSAWGQLVREFRKQRIPVPPVPERFRSSLRRLGALTYSTRETMKTSPYNLSDYVTELESGDPEEYCIVAHAGQGANSWAMHYYVVSRGIAVFVQAGWGGIYCDRAADTRRLVEVFDECGTVQEMAETRQVSLFSDDRRAVAVWSSFYGKRWGRQEPGGDVSWTTSDSPLQETIKHLGGEDHR